MFLCKGPCYVLYKQPLRPLKIKSLITAFVFYILNSPITFYVLFLQDSPQAMSIDTITDRLGLHKLLVGRSWCIQPCDAQSGAGLWEGLEWLSRQLVAAGVIDLA